MTPVVMASQILGGTAASTTGTASMAFWCAWLAVVTSRLEVMTSPCLPGSPPLVELAYVSFIGDHS
jgi:hypothetical protein